MSRARARASALAGAALLGAGACLIPSAQLTMVSPKKVPVGEFRELHIVEGRNCTRVVLGVPLGPLVPSLGKAVENALEREPGADSLINLSIYRDDQFYVFFQQTCVRVKGMAARSQGTSL